MKERPEFDTDEIIERFECEFINNGGYEFSKKRKCPFRFQFRCSKKDVKDDEFELTAALE